MSHPIIKTACVMAGLVVAALAANTANAGAPLNAKQKNEMAEAMARNYDSNGESIAPGVSGPDAAEVPKDVYNYLTASPDAKGRMHVRDTDAHAHSTAPAVEVSNEK